MYGTVLTSRSGFTIVCQSVWLRLRLSKGSPPDKLLLRGFGDDRLRSGEQLRLVTRLNDNLA